MWISLASSCLELSFLPGPGYLFPSTGQRHFQPLFIQIVFLSFSLSLSLSCSGGPINRMVVYKLLSHRPLKLCSFFKFFFYFCCSNWVISTALSSGLLICSTSSNQLLISSSVFFTSVIVFFISDWFYFYVIYLFVDVFSEFICFYPKFRKHL